MMDKRVSRALQFAKRKAWRRCLGRNYASKKEVLLILYEIVGRLRFPHPLCHCECGQYRINHSAKMEF